MRVLVLMPQPLHPIHDGLNLRVYHLFREVARSHDVWIIFFYDRSRGEPADGAPDTGFAGVLGVEIRGSGGVPFRHCRDFAPEAARRIAKFLAETPIDAVVAESIYMLPYAGNLLERPVVLDLVDNMALMAWRSFRAESDWRQRARQLRTWYYWRRYERRNLPHFPWIVVCSPQDAGAVTRHAPAAAVCVVPNGVDAEYFQPVDTRARGAEVVFTGVMGFPPNEAAAIHFYTRIFPLIKAEVPDVRLTLAGKGPTRRLQELIGDDPSATLTGYVDDIRPYLGRATVYVAPMVSGTGIKNKILEAWAMARPVVATPMACQGLDGVPGETHLVAESPAAFADSVVRLLRDRNLGERVGRQARRLVLERYQWSVQAGRLAGLLDKISGSQSSGVAVHAGVGPAGN